MFKIIEAIYLGSSIAGALLVALNVGMQLLGYTLFLVSSIAGSYLLMKSNASKSLLTVTIIFGIINIIGIARA